jgi:DNA-binding SARP family transcriptional activator/pimeloyl-ACP methyl ester carboxylesterase
MRFRILGPLEVFEDRNRISVGGPQQQALLAVLLLHANRVVSADQLIEYLWSQETPSSARGLLQGCVTRLRRALLWDGRQPLVTRAPGYVLEVGPDELDQDRFEELAAAALKLVGDDSVPALEERSALPNDALALWRGPVLDGIPSDASRLEATRLEERRLAVLEERVEVDLRLGRHSDVVGELRSYVGTYPLRERFWGLLMSALARSGRQADALAAYQELRDILRDQLGVDPSAKVQELHQQILSGHGTFSNAIRPAEQLVRFMTSQGRRVAWSIVGSGPVLVVGGWFCSHLELDWRNPTFRGFVGALAERFTVVRYDRPGIGLSDRDELPSIDPDDEVGVLAAVVDEAAGAGERVSLFGSSSGGCVVAAYAAREPERVDRLVLYGSYANGADIAEPSARESLLAVLGAHGGVGARLLADIFVPSGRADERDEFVRYLRVSTTPAITQASLRTVYGFDVRDQLGDVRAPTLVLHRREDRAIPFALGQDLARRIPGAAFVALDGKDHLPWRGDAETLMRTAIGFLREETTAGMEPWPSSTAAPA